MPKTLKIFYHQNCFDGASSAAIFADFYRENIAADAAISYQGVQHRTGDPFEGDVFDCDDHACVDFRYSTREEMTWWFDHHKSAFQPPTTRRHFEADASGQKFYDPTAVSCTGFIHRTLRKGFNYEPQGAHWAELVHWAEKIDGAQYASPTEIVSLELPALRLMTWIENNRDAVEASRLIDLLGRRPIAELVREPWVAAPLQQALRRHEQNVELVGRRQSEDGGVVFFDLSEDDAPVVNKFIPYLTYPEAWFTVGVTASSERARLSVGYNPWREEACPTNVAEMCERHGGGGHPVVGGVSRPIAELDEVRSIAKDLCAELRAVVAAQVSA